MATNSHVYKENLTGFESWLKKGTANSNVFGKDSSTYDKFSINDPDQWTNISFGNLLRAMGKKATMENALTHDNFAKSSASSPCFQPQFEDPLARTGFAADPSTISAPYFHSQVEGSQFQMSSGNSTVTDRSSTPARHFPDLNSPPKIISDAILRRRTLCKFEAIIPEKANRGEYQQERAMKHSSIDKAAMGEKNEICRDGVMLLLEQKEESHLVSEQHPQRRLPHINKENHMIVCTRGKCQIVFSDVTHDKEPNTFGQGTPKSPSDHRQRHMSDSRKTDQKTTQRIKRRRSEGPTPGHSRTMAASP